jgi:hypothetical protein
MDGAASFKPAPSGKALSLIVRFSGLAHPICMLLILDKSLISLVNFLRDLQASLEILLNQDPGGSVPLFPTNLSTISVHNPTWLSTGI